MKHSVWIVLLASFVNGADLPTNARIETVSDFSGGLNTLVPAHKLNNTFSPYMRNVFTHRKPGKLLKRNGFVEAGSTSSLVDGRTGFTFYHNDGSKEFLVSDSSMLLSTQDFNTYVFISSALNVNAMLEFAQINNKVYCTNGVEPVFTWDGSVKQVLDGTNGLPNVPRGRHIAAYQNRIFVGNTTADNTSLDWSAVSSTGGAILTPDHYLAWPDLNNKSIGSTDGEALTSLWVQRGQLQIGKEGSIWTLFGDSDSSYIERKIEPHSGVASQESVVLLDGMAYYKGRDGIYAYNGSFSQRISDLIEPDIKAMSSPSTRIVQETWESKPDFDKGYHYGTEGTNDGKLSLKSTIVNGSALGTSPIPGFGFVTYSDGSLDNDNSPGALTPSATFYGEKQIMFSAPSGIESSHKIWPRRIQWTYSTLTGSCFYASMTVINNITKERYKADGVDQGSRWRFTFSSSVIMDGFDILNSSMAIKLEGCGYTASDVNSGIAFQFTNATTGQYISDISTATSITSWGNFDSQRETNGGNINYFFRSGTAPVNVSTQIWNSVVPGTIINANTQNLFKQWAATLTAVSFDETSQTYVSTASIDNVKIGYIQGSGASNRPVAIDWNNEYWLSVATDLASSMRLQYVKSWITNTNPNSWNVMSQMNIGSLFKDGSDTLYGGSSNSGVFYRLDYGTNDDGQAIDAFYDTPEMTFDGALGGKSASDWWQKQLHERWVDIDKENGNTLRLGTSIDGGDFTERLIPLDGTGSLLYTDYTPKMYGKTFRFRIRSNALDKSLNFNALGLVYTPLATRGN